MVDEDQPQSFEKLAEGVALSDKLASLFQLLRARFPFVDHVSVTTYDAETDLLKTFLHAGAQLPAISNYEARLAETPLLQRILDTGQPRVIDDLRELAMSPKAHTQRLLAAGYRSSYTLPMYLGGKFYGFIFFDSLEPNRFTPPVTALLDPFARLFAVIVVSEIRLIHGLTAATRTMRHIMSRRDFETGAHLERMSRYSRLLARELAPLHGLSDEYVEHLFLFSPLHDIGKIAIPDSILLKSGPLLNEEYDLMKSHTRKGLEIVDSMLKEFGFTRMAYADMLRNIVYYHHEAMDGSGYPEGLRGEAIPVEARITTATDVFDALSSQRPYKPAWPIDRTFETLRALAGHKLDPECVEVLIRHRDELEAIRTQFSETVYG